MRALIVLLLLTATARADGGYAQVSGGPVFGWLDRTTTYVGDDEPGDVVDTSEPGVGVEVVVTGGYEIDEDLRAGLFGRFQSVWTGEMTVRTTTLGPTVTYFYDRHLFARLDLGFGAISGRQSGAYALHTDGFSLKNVALWAGYEIQRWQFGGTLAGTWNSTQEEGDFGDYEDDTALVALSVFASAIIR